MINQVIKTHSEKVEKTDQGGVYLGDQWEEQDVRVWQLEKALDRSLSAAVEMEKLNQLTQRTDSDKRILEAATESLMKGIVDPVYCQAPLIPATEEISLSVSLKSIWDVIVLILSKTAEAVADWFNENLTRVGFLKSAAGKLSTQAFNSRGIPHRPVLEMNRAQFLVYEGNDAGISARGIQTMANYLKDNLSAITAEPVNRAFVSSIQNWSITDNDDAQRFVETVKKSIENYNNIVLANAVPESEAGKRKRDGEIRYGYVISDFPGGAYVQVTPSENAVTPVKIDFIGPEKHEGENKRMHKALTADEIASLCAAIERTADLILNSRKTSKFIKKLNKDIVKAGKSLIKGIQTDAVTPQRRSEIESILRSLKVVGQNARRPYMATLRSTTLVLAASYAFANQSFMNLKTPDQDLLL